jgi:hypothetical protein
MSNVPREVREKKSGTGDKEVRGRNKNYVGLTRTQIDVGWM